MDRRNWTQMGRDTFLRAQLHETMEDIEAARAKGSATVLANLRRLAIEIRSELDEMAATEAETAPEEEMTEGELVKLLIDSVRHLPVDQDEALAAVVEIRLGTTSGKGGQEALAPSMPHPTACTGKPGAGSRAGRLRRPANRPRLGRESRGFSVLALARSSACRARGTPSHADPAGAARLPRAQLVIGGARARRSAERSRLSRTSSVAGGRPTA